MGITLNLTDEEAREIRSWADIHIPEEENVGKEKHAEIGRRIRDKIQRAVKR